MPGDDAQQVYVMPANELSRLTVFHGNSRDKLRAEDWADMVDRFISVLKWNPEQTAGAAIESMREDANVWRVNLSNGSAANQALLKDWNLLRPKFLARFAKNKTRASKVQGIGQLKQAPIETIAAFNDRVVFSLDKLTARKRAAARGDTLKGFVECREMFENAIFLCGMRQDIRIWVEMDMKEDTSNEDILELANKAELAINARQGKERSTVNAIHTSDDGIDVSKLQNELKELKDSLRGIGVTANNGFVNAMSTSNGNGRNGNRERRGLPAMADRTNPMLCWKCKQWGKHISTECKLTPDEIQRLTPMTKEERPVGPATDSQFPNV